MVNQHLISSPAASRFDKAKGPSPKEIEFMEEVESLDLNLSDIQTGFLRIVIRLKEESDRFGKLAEAFEEAGLLADSGDGLDSQTALALLSNKALLLDVMQDFFEHCKMLEVNNARFGAQYLSLAKLVREKIYGSSFDDSQADIDPRLIQLVESVTAKSDLNPKEMRAYWEKRFELSKEEFEALYDTLENGGDSLFGLDNPTCPLTGLVADATFYDYEYCSYNVHHSVIKDFLRLQFKYFGKLQLESLGWSGIVYTSFDEEILFNCPSTFQIEHYLGMSDIRKEDYLKESEHTEEIYQVVDRIGVLDEKERREIGQQYENFVARINIHCAE